MARGKRGTGAAGAGAAKASNDSAQRFGLGPFWLWYRRDRDDWNICWLDGRVTRRASTGIGGDAGDPPEEAKLTLIDHYTAWKAKAEAIEATGPLPPGEVLLADLTAAWLEEHVAQLDAPERYLDSVERLEMFWAELRGERLLPEPFTVSKVSNGLVDQFIAWRAAQGVSAPTISRDLAALRGPINWGLKPEIGRLTSAPRVKDVKGRKRPKDLEWTPEQIAVLLETARSSADRRHIHLFAMIMLSTHARAEATLELDADTQIKRGMIHFLRPGEDQTRKRRTIVPICPTLAPWLEGATGKVIRYRVPTSDKARAAGAADFAEKATNSIKVGFAGLLRAAHEARPDLGFAAHERDNAGELIWLPARKKLGETAPRPKMKAIGSPNTLRHSIHTWHKRFGVPDAQIDAAAGHSEQGTGANYTHLRPEYLREFIASTEAFWEAVGEHTDAHLRYQRDTKLVELAAARVRR